MSVAHSPVRLGFIGAGWWATSNHMPLLAARGDVEFRGVCRLGREELERVRQRFAFPFATEDYRELLDRCELDAVVVSSPHTLHYEHAKAALERGLHVMCEKPLTVRASHARELVRLAQTRGRHLLVPYGWHYKPFLQQAIEAMRTIGVGKIEHVLCHMASPIRRLLTGQGMKIDDVSGQSGANLFEPDPATWADPVVAGGGYAHAQLSHALGLLFTLADENARSVYAVMANQDARVDLYDAMTIQFQDGAIGTVSGAGTLPTELTFQVDIRVFGSEGVLLLDCERARFELRRHDGRNQSADVPANAGGYECAGPPHNFIDLILGRTQRNWATGEAAARSVELLDAAYRSARSGNVEAV